MKIKRMIEIEDELNITGATLLSVEEAANLPVRLGKYDCWWWLRSPGFKQYHSAFVYKSSVIDYGGEYTSNIFGRVRPALIFSNTESSNFKIGDCFSFDGKEFEIISDNLAFCKSDIGHSCFRLDYKAHNANNYEVSDIKKFVDNWFRKAKEEE